MSISSFWLCYAVMVLVLVSPYGSRSSSLTMYRKSSFVRPDSSGELPRSGNSMSTSDV